MSRYDPRYAKRWRLDRARGILRNVDAADARRHVDSLTGAGWSLRAIAGAAGVSAQTVSRIHRGHPTANRDSIAAILAVDVDQVPSVASGQTTEPFVPRIGSVRRVQALLFMGWTHEEIGRRGGFRSPAILHQQGRWVTRSTHDKVAAVYAELAMTPGPSETTRSRARRLGYVGPMSWDDIDLDAEPAVDRPDFLEETLRDQVARLLADGRTVAEIAAVTGASRDSVYEARSKLRAAGLDDGHEVDEVAVMRAAIGDRSVRLTKAERLLVVTRLHAEQMTDVAIGDRLGLAADTIRKDRLELGLVAVGTEERAAS